MEWALSWEWNSHYSLLFWESNSITLIGSCTIYEWVPHVWQNISNAWNGSLILTGVLCQQTSNISCDSLNLKEFLIAIVTWFHFSSETKGWKLFFISSEILAFLVQIYLESKPGDISFIIHLKQHLLLSCKRGHTLQKWNYDKNRCILKTKSFLFPSMPS